MAWENKQYKTWRTKFNGFYRLRRNQEFQKKYYQYLLDNLNNDLSFEKVITDLQKNTNRIEASFASKLIATINSDKPIWDTEVLSKLNIKAPYYSASERIPKIIGCYAKIEEWYSKELISPIG